MYAVAVVVEALEEDDIENWRVISYLPMAHIAERVTGHYQALVTGGEVSTCPDPSLLPAYLGEVHPSLLFGVPRVFEKVYAGVHGLAADPERQKAFNDGVAAALEIKEAERVEPSPKSNATLGNSSARLRSHKCAPSSAWMS